MTTWGVGETHFVLGAVQVIEKTRKVYGQDVERCLRELDRVLPPSEDDFKFWSRTAIRAFFAFVEAQSFVMRQVASEAYKHQGIELSHAEAALLAEKGYFLQKTGVPEERSHRHRLLPGLRFSFQQFAKVARVDFSIDDESEGWQALCRLKQVRDELMHPTLSSDFEPSYQCARDLRLAEQWFSKQVGDLYQEILVSIGVLETSDKDKQADGADQSGGRRQRRGAGSSGGLSTSGWQAILESSADPPRGERSRGPPFQSRNSPRRPEENLPHASQPAGPNSTGAIP